MAQEVKMAKRVQSPSSIKTYKQCPRKYYYSYILKLPQPPNIHQVRGTITHSVLEHFFEIDTSALSLENCKNELKVIVQKLLLTEWSQKKTELDKVKITKEQEMHYFEDTMMMLFNWVELFCTKIEKKKGTFQERFKELTPERELKFVSENYSIQGYIDAIENHDGHVRLMDYKTSKNEDINEHLLQLGIYSLLYQEKHGILPKYVGVYFLKGQESQLEVDEELLNLAKKEIQNIHERTQTENIHSYPKQPSSLCKWSTGQCEFFDICRPFEK